jgi:peptide/nickel transport system permease protein
LYANEFATEPTPYIVEVVGRLRRNRFGVVGLLILGVLVLISVFAPLIAPYDPNMPIPDEQGKYVRWQPPSQRHLLGTDSIGRDVLSRIIFATRISLSAGVIATLIATGVGVLIGSLAGYFGGWVDSILMRLTDVVLAFPVIFLLIVLAAMVRPSIVNVFLIIGLVYWTRTARIVRGEFLKLREMAFIEAATALGVTPGRTIVYHLLPNAVSPIVVAATLRVAYAILLEATLSFLGIGVQEPTPSWGRMLNQATAISVLDKRPWLWAPPGLAILLTVLAINFVGDALRDAVDPRLVRRA